MIPSESLRLRQQTLQRTERRELHFPGVLRVRLDWPHDRLKDGTPIEFLSKYQQLENSNGE